MWSFSVVTVLLLSTFLLAEAVTKRTARVKIVNSSGGPVASVSVAHKYSDVYKQQKTWTKVGKDTDNDFIVEYNTGFATTGVDWWLVVWETAEGKRITTPANFRGPIDTAEQMAYAIVGKDSCGGSIGREGPDFSQFASVDKTTEDVATYALSLGGTVGFKRHTLRAEDENKTTIIELKKNGDVIFQSESGESATVSTPLAKPEL